MKLTELTTPRGIAVYPHLNEADMKFDSQKAKGGEWHVDLRLTEEAALPLIEKLEGALNEWVKVKNAEQKEMKKKPFKRFTKPWEAVEDENGEPTGDYIIKFKRGRLWKDRDGNQRTNTIEFVDGQRQTIAKLQDVIGGGSELCIHFGVRGWASALGASVALDILKVQIVKLASLSGSGGENPFEAHDDGEAFEPKPESEFKEEAAEQEDDTPACEPTADTSVLDGDF